MAQAIVRSFFALIDEHHSPPFRHTFGRLMAAAEAADIAVAHLRLARLNLTAAEGTHLRRCRVMLGHLDAGTLLDARVPVSGGSLAHAAAFAESGRLQIRTAPHHTWDPDFSVFTGLPARGAVALVGAHYFGKPYPCFGTAFTCVLTGAQTVRLCRARFEQLWTAGYDVLPVVADTLRQLAANESG